MRKYTRRSRKRAERTKLTRNDKAFIEFVKAECKRTGVKCDLRPTTWVKVDGIQCSGYFDEENMRLVVAMNKHDSLGILVHEYCHLTQWEEGAKVWIESDKALRKLDDWLAGKRVHNIQKHLGRVRDMELDNERRSVRMIKKWKLSIDTKQYTKGANAYVQFYNWLYFTRKWSKPSNAPYGNDLVLNAMSDKFNMKYKQMSQRILEVFTMAEI